MTAKTERQLEPLPDYDAELSQWRDWLTTALRPAFGRVENFIRHGRQRVDRCELVILGVAGETLLFDVEEQRLLSTPGTQRQTLVSATDGLLRPPALTKAEQEDIWTALVTLATVTACQDAGDEASDWLAQAESAAKKLTGHTLRGPGRLEALEALAKHGAFTHARALEFADPRHRDGEPPRPALLVDKTGERWMRVGDVAAFLRYCTGAPPMSQLTLDGRLAAVGVTRVRYGARSRSNGRFAQAKLYRLPEPLPDPPDTVDVDQEGS
jgi:hypothetical protein